MIILIKELTVSMLHANSWDGWTMIALFVSLPHILTRDATGGKCQEDFPHRVDLSWYFCTTFIRIL